MSYWCEKCQTLNYSGNKCSKCGHINQGNVSEEEINQTQKNDKMNPCVTCEKDISKNAKTCPHCGEQSPQPISTAKVIFMLIFAIIFFIVSLALLNIVLTFTNNAIEQLNSLSEIKK